MKKEITIAGLILLIICALVCQSFIEMSNLKSVNQSSQTFQFLDKYPFKALPLTDSTNFDNYKNTKALTAEQSKLLKLSKIKSDEDVRFKINYRLNISPNFKSLVVSYYPNEQELVTVLINYTNSFDIIDFKTIAYDEIAESFLQIKSRMGIDKIEIIQRDGSSGSLNFKVAKFEIKKDGQIKVLQ